MRALLNMYSETEIQVGKQVFNFFSGFSPAANGWPCMSMISCIDQWHSNGGIQFPLRKVPISYYNHPTLSLPRSRRIIWANSYTHQYQYLSYLTYEPIPLLFIPNFDSRSSLPIEQAGLLVPQQPQ